jgi:Uma2 family endonuclease
LTVQTERAGQMIVLDDVSWDYYTHTLKELGPSRGVRVTFDDGRMEIVTTSNAHERAKVMISRLIGVYALEADVPVTGDGSLTLRSESLRRGLEPDDCYYVTTPAPPPSAAEFDLAVNPPPDLAIEVEVSKGAIPKQPIYASLNVREVWRYAGDQVIPLRLTGAGVYERTDRSLAFPNLPMDVFSRFVKMGLEQSQHEAVKAFRDWLRARP